MDLSSAQASALDTKGVGGLDGLSKDDGGQSRCEAMGKAETPSCPPTSRAESSPRFGPQSLSSTLQGNVSFFFSHNKLETCNKYRWASQVVLVVKNPPANAGDLRDSGSIPGLGRSPG